jgi:O-antigen/teichoic acid export membrane protein
MKGTAAVPRAISQLDIRHAHAGRAALWGASPFRTIFLGALGLLSAQPLTWASSLLVMAFIPRYLSDQDLGRSVVASTIAGLAGAVLSLGLTTSLTRRVASRPERAATDATGALAVVLALSVPAAIGLCLAGPLLGFPIDGDAILAIALATMVITMAQNVLFAVLIGQQRHACYAWLNATGMAIAAMAGVAVLVAGGTLAAFMAVGAVALAGVTVFGWAVAGLGFRREGLRPRYLVQMVREGLPFVGSGIANRLRGDIEVALLAALVSQQVVGWWGAAVRIIGIPIFIPVLVTTPLLPALSRCVDDRAVFRRTLQRSLVLMLGLTVPACALIIALAPVIPGLLGWQAGFDNAARLIMVLGPQVPLVATGMVLGTSVVALGDELAGSASTH